MSTLDKSKRISPWRRGGIIFFCFLSFYSILALVKLYNQADFLKSDPKVYYQLASNIKEGNGFSVAGKEPYSPDLINMPLFPLFISLFMYVFGNSFHIAIIIFMHCILACLTLLILYKYLNLVSEGKNDSGNLIAVIIFGISPTYITLTLSLYSEILFLFIYIIALCLLIYTFKNSLRPKLHQVRGHFFFVLPLMCGIFFGLSTLTRSVSLFLIGIIFIFLLINKKILIAILVTSGFMLSIAPWLLRNYTVFHRFELSNNGYLTFYKCTAEHLISPEELAEYQQQNSIVVNEGINQDSIKPMEYYDLNDAANAKHLTRIILKKKWKIYILKTVQNIIDYPISRGNNILTDIFSYDYEYYRKIPINNKIKDFKFINILIGVFYSVLYKLILYVSIIFGVVIAIVRRKSIEKRTYIFIFLISYYFIIITSATVLNDLDVARLVLPSNLGLMAFAAIAAQKILKLESKYKRI
ncbi:hypothetical protein ACFLR7_00345 [Acidobacteriota bacterium]